jgi:ABC-type dipeptide/oligopeptide/nickel transport system permease subunit
VGHLLVLIFSVWLEWLPSFGMYTIGADLTGIAHAIDVGWPLILPAITLALFFLGLGDPNLMSWGFMIGAGRSVIRLAWWMSMFPGIAIFLTVLALNLVGEGLNDALNPRLARRRRMVVT